MANFYIWFRASISCSVNAIHWSIMQYFVYRAILIPTWGPIYHSSEQEEPRWQTQRHSFTAHWRRVQSHFLHVLVFGRPVFLFLREWMAVVGNGIWKRSSNTIVYCINTLKYILFNHTKEQMSMKRERDPELGEDDEDEGKKWPEPNTRHLNKRTCYVYYYCIVTYSRNLFSEKWVMVEQS